MSRSRKRLVAITAVLALLNTACSALPFGAGNTYEIEVEFARSYNLFPGSPVRVLGTDVGKVADIEVPEGGDSVLVTLALEDGVSIPADASARIVPESLLGERYIQLDPAWTGGPKLAAGDVIPRERTGVPAEFDEVLDSLNDFVGGLDEDEVARLFDNLADVLEGQGGRLGRTIDQAHEAIGVLRDNDDDLVALAGRLADLNETLGTRDEAMGQLIEDWNTLTGSLVADRDDIDGALTGLVRLTGSLGDLLQTHRVRLQGDVEILTRVTRTANRNLDNLALAVLGGAELFRHARRVIDRDTHNWLPLLNHSGELEPLLADTLVDRLDNLCRVAGITTDDCQQIPIEELVGGELCIPPVIPCERGALTLEEALGRVIEAEPRLGDALLDQAWQRRREERRDGALTDGDLTEDSGGDLLDPFLDLLQDDGEIVP